MGFMFWGYWEPAYGLPHRTTHYISDSDTLTYEKTPIFEQQSFVLPDAIDFLPRS
jgi:hypothetical protein